MRLDCRYYLERFYTWDIGYKGHISCANWHTTVKVALPMLRPSNCSVLMFEIREKNILDIFHHAARFQNHVLKNVVLKCLTPFLSFSY